VRANGVSRASLQRCAFLLDFFAALKFAGDQFVPEPRQEGPHDDDEDGVLPAGNVPVGVADVHLGPREERGRSRVDFARGARFSCFAHGIFVVRFLRRRRARRDRARRGRALDVCLERSRAQRRAAKHVDAACARLWDKLTVCLLLLRLRLLLGLLWRG